MSRVSISHPASILSSKTASNQDQQTAVEMAQLGHGLFTHALLLGLGGKADGDSDEIIRVSEILAYVSNEVERISSESGNTQYPTFALHGDDFPVAVY